MPEFNRPFWRAAGELQKSLQPPSLDLSHPHLATDLTTDLPRLTQRLQAMQQRGWHIAARHVRLQLQTRLLEFQRQTRELLEVLSNWRAVHNAPTQTELYEELVALATEFESCDIDLKTKTLSVVTESIVLENVELGPFRIVLPWGARFQHQAQPYTVEALEPCCTHSNSQITHPHVIREQLCEGEAKPALKQALQAGRLTDFFQIIDRVLHTYNSRSPYASLDEWDGIECHSCGTHVSGDADYCGTCVASVCYDCGTYCQFCDCSACDACLLTCIQCEERSCPACLKSCSDCGQKVCPQCMAINHLCQECSEANPSESDQSTVETTAAETDANLEVQSAGLGQVIVLA